MTRPAAIAVLAAFVAVACGGGATPSVTAGSASGAVGEAGAGTSDVIRFTLPPDPLWQWLTDTGAVAAWEREHNIRIEASFAFDQFASFVGGHTDVVLVNSLDVPKFSGQSDRTPLIVAKYTTDRSLLAVPRSSNAESLEDLVEQRIAVESSLGSTLLWALVAEILYDLDFRPDSEDFDVVVVDSASVADLVTRGDVAACVCKPDTSVGYLASGKLRPLYDGQSAAELYAAGIFGGRQFGGELGTIAAAFVTDATWHQSNGKAMTAFLELWESGLAEWREHYAQIVADYPYLFAVEGSEDVAWMVDYIESHDWVVPSIYISPNEAATHEFAYDRLLQLGLLDAGAARPTIDLTYSQRTVSPATDSEGGQQ